MTDKGWEYGRKPAITRLLLQFFFLSSLWGMIWYGTPRSGNLCLDKGGKDLKIILE